MDQTRKEMKDNVLTLAVTFPDVTDRVIRRFIRTKEGLEKFAWVVDALGLEWCRQIFDGLSDYHWKKMRQILREGHFSDFQVQTDSLLLEVYTALLVECLDWEQDQKRADLFVFLRELSSSDLRKVLNDEEATQIAMVSLYWDRSDFAILLKCLDPVLRKWVLLQATRLEGASSPDLDVAAQKLAHKLIEKISGWNEKPGIGLATLLSPRFKEERLTQLKTTTLKIIEKLKESKDRSK